MEEFGIVCELISLDLVAVDDATPLPLAIKEVENAYILILRNGVDTLLENCSEYTQSDLFNEQCELDLDKKAWMRGRVVNKHARWNLCFDTYDQEPDYENKKGRIVSYSRVPITQLLLNQFSNFFGTKADGLKGEGNYYYDRSKCGIGFHGDSERRKVIGVRLGYGESFPICYQWYYQLNPVGRKIQLPLNGGDIYIMSEKTVGTDWKRKNICTLRHATGCSKYTEL